MDKEGDGHLFTAEGPEGGILTRTQISQELPATIDRRLAYAVEPQWRGILSIIQVSANHVSMLLAEFTQEPGDLGSIYYKD